MQMTRGCRPLLIVLASIAASACGDANETSELGSRHLRRSSPPAAGSAGDHDQSDLEGANDSDPGNPNADSLPGAPTSPGTASSQFALTLPQNTPSIGLGETIDLDVVVEPRNGFSGNVALSVSGLPAGVTSAPAQATVSGSTTVKVRISAAYETVTSAPGTSTPITVTANGGAATANASFKVAPRVKLTIPVNVDALRAANVAYRDQWGVAFGANQKALRTQIGNGVVVTVFNADSKQHIIHGASGFAHGDENNPIQPNAFELLENGSQRTRTFNVGANANGYPHDGKDGEGASFRIKVEAAP